MKTTYRLVDKDGDEFRQGIPPWEVIQTKMVSVQLIPNNDPEDPSEDELVVTLEHLHEESVPVAPPDFSMRKPPYCALGNSLQLHVNPCGPGCEYPKWTINGD